MNYTGFQIDTPESGKQSIKQRQWEILLADFDVEVIQQATLQIIATRGSDYNWAPDIKTVREQCLNLSSGLLTTPNGAESWERILDKIAEPAGCENRLELTDEEKKALSQTASIYDLKHGNIKSMSFARRDYIVAYDAIIAKQRLEILTPRSVKDLVTKNAPALPAPKEQPEHTEPEHLAPDEIKQLVAKVTEGKGL
ncbi:MAG: hypothetical protein ACN4GW_22020 [Desulforhopalus sp.]